MIYGVDTVRVRNGTIWHGDKLPGSSEVACGLLISRKGMVVDGLERGWTRSIWVVAENGKRGNYTRFVELC